MLFILAFLKYNNDEINKHIKKLKPIIEQNNLNYIHFNFLDNLKINLQQNANMTYNELFIDNDYFSNEMITIEKKVLEIKNKNYIINYFEKWTTLFYNRGIQIIIVSDLENIEQYNFLKNNKNYFSCIIKNFQSENKMKNNLFDFIITETNTDNFYEFISEMITSYLYIYTNNKLIKT